MAKTRDYPMEIRDFGKALGSFQIGYSSADVFYDFVDYCIACLLVHGDRELGDRLKAKYKTDYPKFQTLFFTMVRDMAKNLDEDNDWYDVLGTAYEVISSNSKASHFGQFFTPKSLCDMMAQINWPEQQPTEPIRVNDPACGSGRTLLAFNRISLGNYLCGDDLDPVCSKMAAINLAIHGCKGQVCNVNSLDPEDWRFGYEINPWQHTMMGIPHILPIQKQQSAVWGYWESRRNRKAEPTQASVPEPAQALESDTKQIEPKPATVERRKPTKAELKASQLKIF